MPSGFELTLRAGQGLIYYTTDGVTDPRAIGGAVSPAAALYSGPLPLTGTTTVKARLVQSANVWSALTEATFISPQADFDSDGDVDGIDFLTWQRGFGIISGATLAYGDADGNGAVDAVDLMEWQGQLGPTTETVVTTAAAVAPASNPQAMLVDQAQWLPRPGISGLGPYGSAEIARDDLPATPRSVAAADRILSQPVAGVVFHRDILTSEHFLGKARAWSRTDDGVTDKVFTMLGEGAMARWMWRGFHFAS